MSKTDIVRPELPDYQRRFTAFTIGGSFVMTIFMKLSHGFVSNNLLSDGELAANPPQTFLDFLTSWDLAASIFSFIAGGSLVASLLFYRAEKYYFARTFAAYGPLLAYFTFAGVVITRL